MNRAQRRKFLKTVKNKNLRENWKKLLANEQKKDFKDGEKVIINYERIMQSKIKKDQSYLEFVEENKNTPFTVVNQSDKIHDFVTFEENDKWIFHVSDLIKYEEVIN